MNTNITQSETIVKPFHGQERFTVFENIVIDYIMPFISPSAWKILSFIVRKTTGWQKDRDELSISQIEYGTKLSRPTITKGINELEDLCMIKVIRPGNGIDSNTLILNTDYEIILTTSDKETRVELVKKFNGGSKKILLGVVKKFNTQKKDLNINNSSPRPDENEFPPIDPTFAKVSQLYKQEINPMFGSTTSDLLKDLADTYPLDWIEKAFKVAVKANARRLSYIEGTLKKWQEVGHPTLTKQKQSKAKEPEPEPERIDESQYVEVVPKEESHELVVDESWLDEQFAKFREGRNDNS